MNTNESIAIPFTSEDFVRMAIDAGKRQAASAIKAGNLKTREASGEWEEWLWDSIWRELTRLGATTADYESAMMAWDAAYYGEEEG